MSDPFANDERYATYIKMRKMLPEGAVRQKMQNDGLLSTAEIDAFFGGPAEVPVAAARPPLPPPLPLSAAPVTATIATAAKSAAADPVGQLRPASLSALSPSPEKFDLLAAVRRGSKLRAVDTNQPHVAQKSVSTSAANTGGMLGMLAMAMKGRRAFVEVASDGENSETSGFSESESDSD